jgi:hypothetical protein
MKLNYDNKIETIFSNVCSNSSCSMAWYLRRKFEEKNYERTRKFKSGSN